MTVVCSLCSGDTVEDERLVCSSCHKTYHFKCGTGLSVVAQRTISKLRESSFKCPLCIIGEKNTLIHKVLSINQTFNEGKHATNFHLGDALTQADTAPVVAAPEVVVTNVAATTPAAHVPQTNDSVDGPRDERPTLPPSLAGESLTPLHPHDESRAKKFSYLLNSFYRLPGHPNTFCGGDSHLSHLDGKEVDPDDDQVRVRSAGGLCIPAAVHALAQHKRVYKKFKKVTWVLGTNDALHSEQHCPTDREKYLKLLYSESTRIFPKATIYFVLPFIGMKGVSKPFIDELERDIKLNCPNMVVVRPPSMRNKISRKGIHLNRNGRLSFINFLRSTFVTRKQRMFSSDSGRSRSNFAPRDTQGPNMGPPIQSDTGQPPHAPSDPRSLSASNPARDQGLVNDIVTKVMEVLNQQNMLSRYYPPLPAWPPPR